MCVDCKRLSEQVSELETAEFEARLARLSPAKRMRLGMFARIIVDQLAKEIMQKGDRRARRIQTPRNEACQEKGSRAGEAPV